MIALFAKKLDTELKIVQISTQTGVKQLYVLDVATLEFGHDMILCKYEYSKEDLKVNLFSCIFKTIFDHDHFRIFLFSPDFPLTSECIFYPHRGFHLS